MIRKPLSLSASLFQSGSYLVSTCCYTESVRKRLLFIAVSVFELAFICLSPRLVLAAGEGWLSGWGSRKQISISKTNVGASSLTDFPLLVKFSADADLSTALANGYDLRFTASDGLTTLPYERESWSGGGGAAGTGIFWVKVSSISNSTDTPIYIYFNNSLATDGNDAANVWSANFLAVWHLNGTGNLLDSTSNANDCTNSNATTDSSGQFGGSISFNPASSSFLNCGNKPSLTFGSAFTVEQWAKPNTTTGGWYTMVNKGGYNGSNLGWLTVLFNGGSGQKFTYIDVPGGLANATNTIAASSWSHLVFTDNAGSINFYVNGVTNGTGSSPITNATEALLMGARFSVGGSKTDFYNGSLDEVRISSIVRPVGWLNFEYKNATTATNELTFAAIENYVAPCPCYDSRCLY